MYSTVLSPCEGVQVVRAHCHECIVTRLPPTRYTALCQVCAVMSTTRTIVQAADSGLVDVNILHNPGSADFETFIKSGMSPFGITVSTEAWALARGETDAGGAAGAAAGVGGGAAGEAAGAVAGAQLAGARG